MNLVFSQEAENNLETILDFIAEKNPQSALKLVSELRTACHELVKFPYKAPPAPLFYGEDIRQMVFKKRYYIFYLVQDDYIFILRISDVRKRPKKII